jgi:hypothetical protein
MSIGLARLGIKNNEATTFTLQRLGVAGIRERFRHLLLEVLLALAVTARQAYISSGQLTRSYPRLAVVRCSPQGFFLN